MFKLIPGFLVLIPLLISCTDSLPEDVVETEQGLVQGAATDMPGVSNFLGLPYAAPPVGEARWRAPVPPASWDGIRVADLFAVSRITIRKAISDLVSEGALDTTHGSGTFVRSKVEKNFAQLTSFSDEMESRGMTPSSVWLNRSIGTVRPEEALTLRASPGTDVYRFKRIRLADDAPMSIETTTIDASCLPSVESVERSIYAALHKTGNRPVRALQRLSALILNEEQATMLGAHMGDAGLLVERVGFNKAGAAIEFSQSYYRGDTYDFVAELSLSE